MPATETGQHVSAKLSLIGRLLHCQARQFVGFLYGNLLTGGGTCAGIHNVHQRRAPISKSRSAAWIERTVCRAERTTSRTGLQAS